MSAVGMNGAADFGSRDDSAPGSRQRLSGSPRMHQLSREHGAWQWVDTMGCEKVRTNASHAIRANVEMIARLVTLFAAVRSRGLLRLGGSKALVWEVCIVWRQRELRGQLGLSESRMPSLSAQAARQGAVATGARWRQQGWNPSNEGRETVVNDHNKDAELERCRERVLEGGHCGGFCGWAGRMVFIIIVGVSDAVHNNKERTSGEEAVEEEAAFPACAPEMELADWRSIGIRTGGGWARPMTQKGASSLRERERERERESPTTLHWYPSIPCDVVKWRKAAIPRWSSIDRAEGMGSEESQAAVAEDNGQECLEVKALLVGVVTYHKKVSIVVQYTMKSTQSLLLLLRRGRKQFILQVKVLIQPVRQAAKASQTHPTTSHLPSALQGYGPPSRVGGKGA
ncbi:hypothetical protein L226DRAFT_520588 [Lentinus tigrinus ALCF2SS1-7]|uniref:uncharacterized protein n=1 Tax=Lentinus tigrinus ALCF2SS1-7 TaxID=1328758 RepID=UPI001165EEE1|nr:hypothetical protein L226DRAFT_520588 [Lentinus tigrinus ALCF2SS1-7]